MTECGRMNILTKVLMLSSHFKIPKEGHLDTSAHNCLCWLEVQLINHIQCRSQCLRSLIDQSFWDAMEDIPVNAPELRCKEVDIHMFVDSDQAGDKVSCRLRSDCLIYVTTTIGKDLNLPNLEVINEQLNSQLDSA